MPSQFFSDNCLIENQQFLARWISDVEGPLDLAVAFWGDGAIDELGLRNAKRPTRVLLELGLGGTNPFVVKALTKLQHVEVKQLPRLHAKAYITRRAVIIGSTNASTNGLGSEGKQATWWHELALHTNDDAIVRATKLWFERKWKDGQAITSACLKKAEYVWRERQRLRPKVGSDVKDILSAAMKNPGEFRNRGYYVVVTTEDWNKKGYSDAKNYKEQTGLEACGWQDWTDIPKDAILICFSNYKGDDFSWDDPKICYSPGKINQYKSLVLVSSAPLDDGYKTGIITQWAKALAIVKAAIPKKRWNSDAGTCMDLGDFAQVLLDQAND